MSRPMRLQYPGALYHVTTRGNERRSIFRSNKDREAFVDVLGKVGGECGLVLHAYVLMPNHYHLMVETPHANLARAMQRLNGAYTKAFNRAHRRVGHVLQGRYKAIVVQKESYLVELCRYIHLNPVRSRMPVDLDAYPWSSHWDYMGKRKTAWLSTEFVFRHFGGRQKEARARYQTFLDEGKMRGVRRPWAEVKHQSVLGDEGFVERIKARLTGWREDPEVPSGMKLKPRPTPEHVHRAIADALPYLIKLPRGPRLQPERLVTIYLTKKWTGLSLKTIGEHFGLSYSTVSHLAKDVEQRRVSDPRWDRAINQVERCLPANPKI